MRYKEKSTGEYWETSSFSQINNVKTYTLRPVGSNSKDNDIKLSEEELDEHFEEAPWPKAKRVVKEVEPKHPIQITLVCPECGSVLKTKGGAYLTSPLKWEHVCSNKECHYHTCISSYYSGMYAAVTETQRKKIEDGTYDEWEDGEIVRLKEEDMWSFKH